MELVDVLDDLSYRSSRAAQLAALEHIHSLLADVCVRSHDSHQRPRFFQQQNDFETNIVSRILTSGILSASTISRIVDEIRAKASSSSTTADITSLALSALQGMALIHARSKTHLGRRLGIQTLLDLLTALRHASVNPDDPDTTLTSGVDSSDSRLAMLLSPLSCSVVDTLLCLLVDSPLALRVFEECNGLEVIVRSLKKISGQNVRMKCLEFLYFYLQDEDVLAVTGTPAINLPVGLSKPDLSRLTAQPTPKPTRAFKSSASKTRDQTSPTSNHALQTPRRPKTKQTSTNETRTRTRPPMERTVSGDSTFSVSSSRSDATDTSTGPKTTRISGRDPEMRSVSRSSTCSAASTTSNVTDSSMKSGAKPWEMEREPKRPFPRLSVMPSLSYSSSTVSSTATNQTLEHPQQLDKHLRINPQTPSRTRSTTPNSPTQEYFVPLPESPIKAGRQDVQETPKPKRRRDEETPGVKVRDRKVQETPRAKTRDEQAGEGAPSSSLASARNFPALGTNLSEDNPSNPFKNSAYGGGAPRTRPTAPTLVTLSLLKGEVDYEPESPKKQTPSRTVGDEVEGTIKARHKTPSDASSKQIKDSASNPFKALTPKPSKDAISDSKEPAESERPTRRRPRASEILPRPIPSRPVPRNVSTPVGTAPSTPVSNRIIRNATPANDGETSPTLSTTDTTAPGAGTPARTKKVAVIAGGVRVPGRSEGGGNELRKSMAMGAKELKKSQPSSEGLHRSQGSSEALRGSHLSTEALRRNQPSSEALRKSPEATHQHQPSQSDSMQDTPQSKRSAPSTPIPSRSDGARRVMRDGVSRIKRDGMESEGRSSGEMERPGSDVGKRSSIEESPSRTRGIPMDGKMIRTSAEKKELLGAWLGNVDALVEGVQRAGIRGLR
ncbi:cell division control protein 14, SIN component-domain-containing protein [Rhizoctonia solani]|nr:cell division control protein 14, SIN component-domain-containing protein [Rhizoctonia solani]